MSADVEQNDAQEERPLMEHLLELRNRLLRAVIGVALVFLPLAFFLGI